MLLDSRHNIRVNVDDQRYLVFVKLWDALYAFEAASAGVAVVEIEPGYEETSSDSPP
jgi:hypothetical protein